MTMTAIYDEIEIANKGAWVVHHGQKTASVVNGAAEFPALDTAGKAASLLTQLASNEETTIDSARANALAKAAGLNPKIELPALLDVLKRQRLIETTQSGGIAVLGVTSRAAVQHAAEIFDDQAPSKEERATIVLAEVTSRAPMRQGIVQELISDELKMATSQTREMLLRSEVAGFVDAEGLDEDKLYFNGNIFRRDNIDKVQVVLNSLSESDASKVRDIEGRIRSRGFISISTVEEVLGETLFAKLRAIGVYDVNHVANPSGEFGFVTLPAAFHKFNDPLVDDAFDLAKALVSALAYGMTQSSTGRGKIQMIGLLLQKLISGHPVGPATAIGEDYRVLETKGVIQVRRAQPFGFTMRLLKKDVGQMALKVLTRGEAASTNTLDRPLPGRMTRYFGPEATRSEFRRKQMPSSRKASQDVLEALRTQGDF